MDETNAFGGPFAVPQAGADGAKPVETGKFWGQDTTPPEGSSDLAEDGAVKDWDYDSDSYDDGENEHSDNQNNRKGGDVPPSGEPGVTIKFNHKSETITAGEAAVRIQKYMQMDPVIAKLKYMAAASGQSVTQLMEGLFQQNEKSLIYKMADKFGNDSELVGEAMKVLRQKNENAFLEMVETEKRAEQDADEGEKDNLNRRLAADFLELKAEFPELGDFSKIPEEVIQSAAEKGISLMDSFLRFRHFEQKKSDDAEQARQIAAKASTGSQKSADLDAESPEISAMVRGIWG